MKFKAIMSLEDGRITGGVVYYGSFVNTHDGLRVIVYDNRKEWMTFNPKTFAPVVEQ